MTDLTPIHQAQDAFLGQWGAHPNTPLAGRGIVTSIYDAEFASGYVQLREMERLGVTLPVQVWYRPGELSAEQLSLLDTIGLNLEVRELLDPGLHGWAVKMFAILRSQFEEVLWIDTDNVPIRDPEFLFDDHEYQAKGSLFWRDVSGVDRAMRWHPGSPLWAVMRVPYNDCEEFEAGQFLLNKAKCWRAFGLALHYNIESHIYYQVLHGDKDTMRFAFQRLDLQSRGNIQQGNYLEDPNRVPFGMMPFGPFHIGEPNPWRKWGGGSVMQQRDRQGQPLFNHRSINKFTLDRDAGGKLRETSESWKTYGPAEEQHYLRHLADLRSLLPASS